MTKFCYISKTHMKYIFFDPFGSVIVKMFIFVSFLLLWLTLYGRAAQYLKNTIIFSIIKLINFSISKFSFLIFLTNLDFISFQDAELNVWLIILKRQAAYATSTISSVATERTTLSLYYHILWYEYYCTHWSQWWPHSIQCRSILMFYCFSISGLLLKTFVAPGTILT